MPGVFEARHGFLRLPAGRVGAVQDVARIAQRLFAGGVARLAPGLLPGQLGHQAGRGQRTQGGKNGQQAGTRGMTRN